MIGISIALASGMKKFKPQDAEEIVMKAPNHMAVLAILGEMARRVNENISKVEIKPLQDALSLGQLVNLTASKS